MGDLIAKQASIHSARTIMFTELEKIMEFSLETGDFTGALRQNVFGKKSSGGVIKTGSYMRRLYGFELSEPAFQSFCYFWKNAEPIERPLLSIVYAIHQDYLLRESIEVLMKTPLGERAAIEEFEACIEKLHPNQFSPNTRKSMAQNIASSWKQAGFIQGKVRNIRVQPEIGYQVAAFAFLLAYLRGQRGEFIWQSPVVKALMLSESRLRDLAIEASRKDLIQYQFAGDVTAISFSHLINKIGIHGLAD